MRGKILVPPSYATMGRASLPVRTQTYSALNLSDLTPNLPPVIDEEPIINVESTLPLLPSLPTRGRPPSARRLKKRFSQGEHSLPVLAKRILLLTQIAFQA